MKQDHGNALLGELKPGRISDQFTTAIRGARSIFTPHRYAGKTSDFDPRKRAEFKNAPFLELTRICQSQWIVAGG